METGTVFKPTILGFLCNWCCYGGADLCGVSRFQYPPYLRVIRVMCSGRVDPAFIFRSFLKGADAVFVGGCHLNDCHYNPEGNYDALVMSKINKKLLERIGVNPERLRLEWVSAGEGIRFAEIMNDFSKKIKKLGPLGSSEGLDKKELRFKLEAVTQLVPYIKLVEREKLRVPVRSEASYDKFLASGWLDRLFDEMIADKLVLSQIMLLLREKPRSTVEIAEALGLNPSQASKYLGNSSSRGFIRFDESQKRFVPA